MQDWYDRNAERYDRLEFGLPGDIDFYVALARAATPPVLELGCGTGRVTLAIAQAGVEITGLDRSPRMLAVAARKAGGTRGVTFVRGDMRSFALPRQFGLVCIPFRGFIHLLTDADQRSALTCCRTHLHAGGRLALNIPNWPVGLDELAARSSEHSREHRGGGAYAGRPVRRTSPAEMADLFKQTGFTVEALLGGFGGESFDQVTSTEQVWIARRDS